MTSVGRNPDRTETPPQALRDRRARELEEWLAAVPALARELVANEDAPAGEGGRRSRAARAPARPRPGSGRARDPRGPRTTARRTRRDPVQLELALRQPALRRPRAGGDRGRDARLCAQGVDVHLQGRRRPGPRRARAAPSHGEPRRLRRRRGLFHAGRVDRESRGTPAGAQRRRSRVARPRARRRAPRCLHLCGGSLLAPQERRHRRPRSRVRPAGADGRGRPDGRRRPGADPRGGPRARAVARCRRA